MADTNDKVIVGIHSYILGADNSSDRLIDGHAWMTVTRNGKTTYYGLWPDDHGRVIREGRANGDGTDIRIGMEDPSTGYPAATASRYYELSPEQVKTLDSKLAENVTWHMWNNCASWAADTVHAVTGENLKSWTVTTPTDLVEKINKLEAKQPTSLTAPKPANTRSSSFSMSESNETKELQALCNTLCDGLSDKLNEANAQRFTENMVTQTAYTCVAKGIQAQDINFMDLNIKNNTILVGTQNPNKFAVVDAFEAVKNNPMEAIQQTQQELQELAQQNTLKQTQQQQHSGPKLG